MEIKDPASETTMISTNYLLNSPKNDAKTSNKAKTTNSISSFKSKNETLRECPLPKMAVPCQV